MTDIERELLFRELHHSQGFSYEDSKRIVDILADFKDDGGDPEFHYRSFERGWDAAVESIGFCPSEKTARSWY